ncbi:MAG: NADPH-dependent oxidoreductase [Neisseriaceae bacterium]|nr:MAG: NADPH-dependent oxidoreductase [Neisseriaceae bacterium]
MIVGILGSKSSDSLTRKGMLKIKESLEAIGIEFDLIDLKSEYVEIHDIDDYENPPVSSQTMKLRNRISRAKGVILGSPVYHGSFSGVLKNSLDHLTNNAFLNLPVGILVAGGSTYSTSVVCDQLRTIIRALSGWSAPTHIGISYGDILGEIISEQFLTRINEMVNEMIFFSNRL